MKFTYLAAAAAAAFVATGASAATVFNTSLQNQGGTVGTAGANGVVTPSTRTTTTDATGTRTTVSANPDAANAAANRGNGTPVAGSWYQDNVGMGSTVGITTNFARSGNGSAYFNQVQADNGKADLQYYFATGPVALSSLTSFSYDYFRSSTSTNDPIQTAVLRLNILRNGSFAGTLVYEPFYTTGGNVPVDTWTTGAGDLTTGKWWSTSASLGATPQTVFQTLQEWINSQAQNGATLSVNGIQVGFGSGWQGTFTGAVDNVNIAFGSTVFNSNFEVQAAAGAVPEPATWALMMLGFGLLGATLRRRKATVRFA